MLVKYISNSSDEINLYRCLIFIFADAPTVGTESTEVHFGVDGKVTLDCQVESEPASKVTWYHDGFLLHPSSSAEMRRDGSCLLYTSPSPRDS